MKDTVLICGALSAVSKCLVEKILDKRRVLCICLVDLPEKKTELDNFTSSMKEKYADNEIVNRYLDVTDYQNLNDALEALDADFCIKYFVYAVGSNKLQNAFQVTEENWDSLMNLNLKSFFFCAQSIGALMMKNGGGSIVSIASQHGSAPNYDRAVYCASKAGMINLTKVLALEWAKYKIRVNTVSPSIIACEGNLSVTGNGGYSNKWLNSIPLHKYVSPEDVAESIFFLLSEQSSMITGVDLLVDGGWSLKHS